MALPSEADQPSTCPACGRRMEIGYVLGTLAKAQGLYLGIEPTTIGWISGPPAGRGPDDQVRSELLAKVGVTVFSRIPRFPAWRCTQCSLVVFLYDSPVYE